MQTAAPAPQARPTIGFFVGYQLAEGVEPSDLLDDAGCLLEAAGALAANAAHNTNADGGLDQAGLFGIWHLIRLSRDLVNAATATLTKERASCTA